MCSKNIKRNNKKSEEENYSIQTRDDPKCNFCRKLFNIHQQSLQRSHQVQQNNEQFQELYWDTKKEKKMFEMETAINDNASESDSVCGMTIICSIVTKVTLRHRRLMNVKELLK